MSHDIVIAASLLICSMLAGCATPVPADAGFSDVRQAISQRTGLTAQWASHTTADAALDSAVRDLLRHNLTVDAAVQIALLNNANLQATYEELGIAQADLVQAGLLRNPVFDLIARFPDKGPKGVDVEVSVTQDFIDVLLLPLRKKVAAAQFEAAKLRVAGAAVNLSSDVRSAYCTAQAANQTVELRRTAAAAMDAAAEEAQRMHDGGTMNDLDLATEQAQAAQGKLDLAQAEADELDAREKLTAFMGLGGTDTEWKIDGRLPNLPPTDPPLANLESTAISRRLDLAAARRDIQTAVASRGFTNHSRLWADADVGIDSEHNPDGSTVSGPTLSIPLPIFDTGDTAVAKADAQMRQAEWRYRALAVEIRSQVRAARNRLVAARARAEFYQHVVIPLRKRIVEQSQLHYNGMLLGVFQLLQARQAEIDAGREYIGALRDYWIAVAELDRAVGGQGSARDAQRQ